MNPSFSPNRVGVQSGFYLGWYNQPDVLKHPLYDLQMRATDDGCLYATFIDAVGGGHYTGGFDPEGYVWLTRYAGGFRTFYIGRTNIEGVITGGWVMERGESWSVTYPHRVAGMFKFWPLGTAGNGWQHYDLKADDPPMLRVVQRNYLRLSGLFSHMRTRLEQSKNPVELQALQRQYEDMQAKYSLASTRRLPSDDSWVSPDMTCRHETLAFYDWLGRPQADRLFARLGYDAVAAFEEFMTATNGA